MGGKKGNKSKKSKTKTAVQKAAEARHAKFKQTRVQTFGGKRTSFSNAEKTRIKKAGYSVDGYSKAAPNKASGYSGTSGVSVGSRIQNPNPKTTQEVSGIGPVADGNAYGMMLNKRAPLGDFNTNTDGQLVAQKRFNFLNPFNYPGIYKEGEAIKEGERPNVENPGPLDKYFNKLNETNKIINDLEQSNLSIKGPNLAYAGNISDLGIGTTGTTEGGYNPADSPLAGYLNKSLNIGGTTDTNSEESNTRTSRAINNMTSEQLADNYEASLDPNSFKGLSDGETVGVGPVASGKAYAAGLNTDNKNVENRIRSLYNRIPLLPDVRLLTDKEIADKRVNAQNQLAYRNEMARFRKGASGGTRTVAAPVAQTPPPVVPLLEQPVAGNTPPVQSGINNNNLMQIQQQSYLNNLASLGMNPTFRFGAQPMMRNTFGTSFNRAYF